MLIGILVCSPSLSKRFLFVFVCFFLLPLSLTRSFTFKPSHDPCNLEYRTRFYQFTVTAPWRDPGTLQVQLGSKQVALLSCLLGVLWICFCHPGLITCGKAIATSSRLMDLILLLFCLSLQVGVHHFTRRLQLASLAEVPSHMECFQSPVDHGS